MRILKKEEHDQFQTKPPGRVSLLRINLTNMKLGDRLLIEGADWKRKRGSPAALCRRIEKKSTLRFTVGRVVNGNGWVVERVK